MRLKIAFIMDPFEKLDKIDVDSYLDKSIVKRLIWVKG